MKLYIITDVDEKASDDLKYLTGKKVTELVTCKDCKYYQGLAECKLIGKCGGTYWWCGYGEKKEESKMMKYYVAYGSNLNMEQMAYRCPDARPVASGILTDWQLVFNGVLTIEQRKGSKTPVGIWRISADDEFSLDRYEGYPSLYRKEVLRLRLKNKKTVDAIVYIMNGGKRPQCPPTNMYYQTCREGYDDFGLDPATLDQARKEALRQVGRYD